MSDQTSPPTKLWALVVTGVQMPNGLPKYLSPGNEIYHPVPVYFHEDREKVEKRKASLARKIARVKFYDAPGMALSTPYFGVVQVVMPAPKQRKQLTEEHKRKMQEGRKATDASNPSPTVATTKTGGKK